MLYVCTYSVSGYQNVLLVCLIQVRTWKNDKKHRTTVLLLVVGLYLKNKQISCVHMRLQIPPQSKHTCTFLLLFILVGGRQQKVITASSSSSPLPLSSSHYHIGQGLLTVPCQRAENGERKGIMAVRREKRGSGRKEGQTGYYEREGWEQWRHLESLFAFLSHGLRSQSDWSTRPAM